MKKPLTQLSLVIFLCSLLCFSFSSLFTSSLLFPQDLKDEPLIKIISAHRTKMLFTREGEGHYPKKLKKNVLLVLRIGGISIEQFSIARDNKDSEIYVRAGEKKYKLGFSITQELYTNRTATIPVKDLPSKIILAFTVPKEIIKMELVIGNYPHTVFEADKIVSDSLNMKDL